VVVVTTHLEGFLGSGMRLDCENFKDPRLVMASSDRKVSSTLENLTRCGVSGKLVISVENKSLKSLVNGLSSSVMRRILDEVWCILPLFLSGFGIGGIDVLILGSWPERGTPLVLRCVEVWTSGDVGERGRLGRTEPVAVECLLRLPEDVAERRLGVDVVPMEARLAKAFDVFSRASEAKERRLRLWVILVELVWWWYGGRAETRVGGFEVEEGYWAVPDRVISAARLSIGEVMDSSSTGASLGSGMKRTGNHAGKDVQDLDGIRNTSQTDWRVDKQCPTASGQKMRMGRNPPPTKEPGLPHHETTRRWSPGSRRLSQGACREVDKKCNSRRIRPRPLESNAS